jgi:hypothetical protein
MQGAMVRALLEGRKTQTRRMMKTQPSEMHPIPERDSLLMDGRVEDLGEAYPVHVIFDYTMGCVEAFPCPYGRPGDRLWGRETWSHTGIAVWTIDDARRASGNGKVIYRASDAEPCPGCWWPSIHMPREFSRITLEIVSVRVERLWQISEADAIAEGAVRNDAPGEEWDGTYLTQRYLDGIEGAQNGEPHGSARDWYREVWEGINGKGSWALDPWVWVVEFKRV